MNDRRREARVGDDDERFNDFKLFARLFRELEDIEEDGHALNPPRRTYYLGRGRRGNTFWLHRAFRRREEEDDDD